MEQYISKSAVVAEIKTRIETYNKGYANGDDCRADALETFLHDIDFLEVKEIGVDLGDPKGDKSAKYIIDTKTLEVKEMPETAHTECKKIKKLCEIQRYDENGKVYSVMLPDTRLFMNKINDVIDAIDNIESRLQTVEQKI